MTAALSWPDKMPQLAEQPEAGGGGVIMEGGRLLQQGAVPPLLAANAPSRQTRLANIAALKLIEITEGA